mmetsp:Transcript_3604/g.5575  ORF Transcript_3604/g.5575 Transcript_3604/m.5575 type:complete len:193 (-) Transcript_3604:10-588(-)
MLSNKRSRSEGSIVKSAPLIQANKNEELMEENAKVSEGENSGEFCESEGEIESENDSCDLKQAVQIPLHVFGLSNREVIFFFFLAAWFFGGNVFLLGLAKDYSKGCVLLDLSLVGFQMLLMAFGMKTLHRFKNKTNLALNFFISFVFHFLMGFEILNFEGKGVEATLKITLSRSTTLMYLLAAATVTKHCFG